MTAVNDSLLVKDVTRTSSTISIYKIDDKADWLKANFVVIH